MSNTDHITEWTEAQISTRVHKQLSTAVTVDSYEYGVVSQNSAYHTTMTTHLHVHYTPENDADVNNLFQFGYVLPAQWVQAIMRTAETDASHDGWCVHVNKAVDSSPDCVYKMNVCMFSNGVWEVVQDNDFIWEHSLGTDTSHLPMVIDGARLCNAYAICNNSAATSKSNKKTLEPVFVLGFNRVDMGQLPGSHTFTLHCLQLHVVDKVAYAQAQQHRQQMENATHTHVLASIREPTQLQHPIGILTREVIQSVCGDDQSHGILQCTLRGRYLHVNSIDIQLRPCYATQSTHAPTLYATHMAKDHTFACSFNHLFSTAVDSIEVHLSVTREDHEAFELDITDLQLVPVAMQSSVTKLYDEDESESVGFHTIESIKKEVSDLRNITHVIQKTEGPPGVVGKRGAKGERGEAMRYDDLTSSQKEELRGGRGVQGPRGKAMVFEDLTQEQRELLKGDPGDKGECGANGLQGPPGPMGRAFAFKDFSETQRELLRGERGLKGDRGEALTFEELTDAQKKVLSGEKGERGHKGDSGERGERGRVGPTGPIGPEGKQGPRGLPGVPGAKGDKGDTGESGRNGKDGRPAIIKTSFLSVELLRDYVQKSLHLPPNTYYIIDHPSDEQDHGKLFVYTGEIDIELTVCCTYVENIQALFEEYQATVRTTVQTDRDEWKLLVSLHTDDISVYHLRRGLENSITQSGYLVKESIVTEDAIQHIGKLCGVQGSQGERGQQGAAGTSMLGLRLDFIGTEATRRKIHDPEAHSIFLQVKPSKTHEAGFYMFDELTSTWKLLQAVDVNNSFLQWMSHYVDNPHQESIPLVLSMFSTTQKQMEGQYNSVRNELQEYRTTNEKWKKYQFEHWKSMGNSQYQQFNTQLSEQSHVMESVVQQVNGLAEKATSKDEFGVLRKHIEKQNEKLERQYKSVKESLAEYTERQTVDKSVFEQEQDAVQGKLRDLDMSTLKIIKIIQFLKCAPWSKGIKLLKHEHDQQAVLHTNFITQQEKRNKETTHFIEQACPKQLKHFKEDLHKLSDQLTSTGVVVDRKFAEWSDQYDKRLLGLSTEQTDNVMSVEKKIQTTLDKLKIEVTSVTAKKQYAVKQELLERCNELREYVYAHEQDNKKMSQTIVKRVEASESRLEFALKKNAQNASTNVQQATTALQALLEKKLESVNKDTSAKLLHTVDVLQSERKESEEQHANTLTDLQNQLKQTVTDVRTNDEKLTLRLDEQKQKLLTTLTTQVDRSRGDLHKQIRDTETQNNEHVSTLQNELRQQHTQHTYDIKGMNKKVTDLETRMYDDMERKVSTTKTYTDERARELDQKYSNAVQGLTNDAQSIDAKCSAIDYTLKARMESVEEHIQQLFAEGQQQCESMVDKNKKDTIASLEALREDAVNQQQHLQQTVNHQLKRTEASTHDKLHSHQEHFDRIDTTLLESKRALEAFQQHQSKQHSSTVQSLDVLRKEMQQQMHDTFRKMRAENEALVKQLHEVKRDVLSTVQDQHSELRSEVKQRHAETMERANEHQTKQSQHTTQQLQNIRSVVERICQHVSNFTHEEQEQRKQHEVKLENVVAVLEKTFGDMMAE